MIINCSNCGQPMAVDELEGVEYIKEQNSTIHHVICPREMED